jgi:hypothetical protein
MPNFSFDCRLLLAAGLRQGVGATVSWTMIAALCVAREWIPSTIYCWFLKFMSPSQIHLLLSIGEQDKAL